jgi:hypothetical protein
VQEVSKRETALESLRLKAEARARAMRKAWLNVSLPTWTTSSSNTANTTNVGGITINGAMDPKAVAQEVNKVIISANKNANKWSN